MCPDRWRSTRGAYHSSIQGTSVTATNVIVPVLPVLPVLNVHCLPTYFLSQSTIAPFPQDGWTALLLSAFNGHKELVQELCETFGADFLHRMKVRAMQTVTTEWLSEV